MTVTDDERKARRRAYRSAYYRERRVETRRLELEALATRPDGPETITLDELCRRLRLQGHSVRPNVARAWLAEWRLRGLVEEPVPGRYRLTDAGRRVAP